MQKSLFWFVDFTLERQEAPSAHGRPRTVQMTQAALKPIKPNQENQLLEMSWGLRSWSYLLLIGLILMLSPAPWWDESPWSYSSWKGARLVPLLPSLFRPTFLRRELVLFTSLESLIHAARHRTQPKSSALESSRVMDGQTPKGLGGSRHIIVKTYSCLSETLGNLQQITDQPVRASGWDLLFLVALGQAGKRVWRTGEVWQGTHQL